MGERGPLPLPSAVKKSRGTFRPGRAAPGEPQPSGRPSCPAWLSPDAKKEFRRLVKQLAELGVVGRSDGNLLARYCDTWCRWRQVTDLLAKSGPLTVYKTDAGAVKSVQVSALCSVERHLSEQLGRMEQALGLSPSARSRINVQPAAEPMELEF